MKTTAALLVVLSAVKGCKIDNVDTAQISTAPIPTIEQCENIATAIDKKTGQRAFCLPTD